MKILFIVSISIILYHLFIYGLILKVLTFFKKEKQYEDIKEYPTVTVLCPAYNEEKHIEKKIESFLNLDYPTDKIKMIIISDDSTDSTNEIVEKYITQNISLVIQKPRKGKQSGHNLVEPTIKSEIIISTDASSIMQKDSIKILIKPFQDDKVGLVAGKMILVKQGEKTSAEGVYWKYESLLRKLESKYYSNIVASGCLFAIRRKLFTQIHPASPDDFERALCVTEKGFKVIFEERATVEENITEYSYEEINRKIRIITQEWFALFRHLRLLNPFKYKEISFILFSHKLIRWLLPIFSFLILFTNIIIMKDTFFFVILVCQIIFYLSGIVGLLLEKRRKIIYKIFKLQTYFLAMNFAALVAIINVFKRRQFSTWETQ